MSREDQIRPNPLNDKLINIPTFHNITIRVSNISAEAKLNVSWTCEKRECMYTYK